MLEIRSKHNFRGSPYHYIPTEGVAITFIVLYAFSTVAHLGQATYYRMWWLLPTVCLCGLLEIIGWSARLWSSFSPSLSSPFEMQITATILGPTPFLAANFVIFGAMIQRLGTQYSRLSPKMYTILFCTCDVISLIVQAVGFYQLTLTCPSNSSQGGNIMLGGISFQLLTITLYALCASEFYVRYARDWPIRKAPMNEKDETITANPQSMTNKTSLMTAALILARRVSSYGIYLKAVYRTIELSDGWNGRIISTQVYFNVLDGAMVTLAMYTTNIAHPGLLLGRGMGLVKAPHSASPGSDTNSENNGKIQA
ncbi:RTA1-like protein [Pholiota molesta]|nr:RTA1-like protein [Pholiota molesta]